MLSVLLLLALASPGHRLLEIRDTGIAGRSFSALGPAYGIVSVAGTLAAFLLGGLAILLIGRTRIAHWLARGAALLCRPGASAFALITGGLAAILTGIFALVVLGGHPMLVDAASQLVHARYLAEGSWAGPTLPAIEFWDFQYMLETPGGWVSQYPPGHLLALSVGLRLGVVWLVGPVLLGISVFAIALFADALLSVEDRTAGRLGVLLTATSPFLIGLAGSHMSHVSALLGGSVALYAGLRAARGAAWWGICCGVAIGWAVVSRPLVGIVLGLLATVGVWLVTGARWEPGALLRRVGAVLAGGAPFATFLLWYNARFFGSPFRLGYTAEQGSGHGLGFHTDPWGASYGPLEALGYTSVEMRALGVELLQSPVPALLVVAVYGLWVARVPRELWLFVAWAALPVLVNVFYWHHDLVMGPRMLNETAPAWAILTAYAAIGIGRVGAETQKRGARRGSDGMGGIVPATLATAMVVGWLFLAPLRLNGYGAEAQDGGWRASAPKPGEALLVYVHGSWQGRLGARMAGLGMPGDSIRLALGSNPTCALHEALGATSFDRGRVRFERPPVPLLQRTMPSGSAVLSTGPDEQLSEDCLREMASDFAGVVGLPQLMWQGDLPGLGGEAAMFVRDMGPDRNQVLLEAFPERRPAVMLAPTPGATPVLTEYEDGMTRLWEQDLGIDPPGSP